MSAEAEALLFFATASRGPNAADAAFCAAAAFKWAQAIIGASCY